MATRAKEAPAEFTATHRFARISARKARLVVDIIRGLSVEKALQHLGFCHQRGGPMVSKVLRSAMANATQQEGLEPEKLYVSTACVDEGPTLKRWRPRAMGRAFPRLSRTCHIRVAVAALNEPESKGARGKAASKKAGESAADESEKS